MVGNGDSGGRPDVVEDIDVLRILQSCEDPVMSAPEIAEQTRIGDRGMYKKLRRMEESGFVSSKKVGRSRVWWITDSGISKIKEAE